MGDFRICVFSDMHFMAWKETNEPVEWVAMLENATMDASGLNPDAVMVNGDLTNGKDRDYRLAMKHLRNHLQQPLYFTMGNHEYYGYYEDENYSFSLARNRFLHYTLQPSIYYEVREETCTLLCLSPEQYRPDEFGDAAWLSLAQMQWFERRLLAAPHDVPVLVFLHQPINDTVADSTNSCVQSDAIRAILSQRPGCVFITGHTHCRMDRDDQLVTQDNTLYVGGGCVCNDRPQSRWITVGPDKVVLDIRDHLTQRWIEPYHREFKVMDGKVQLT